MKTSYLMAFAALSLVLSACSSAASAATPTAVPTVQADQAIVAEGRVEPVRFANIALNSGGLVSAVPVTEGDAVKAGQIVARLENSEAQDLDSARAAASKNLTVAYQAVRDARFKLDNFNVPTDYAGMTPSEAVAMRLEELNGARKDFEPYQYLNPNKLKHGRAWRNKKALDAAWDRYRRAIQWMDLQSSLDAAQAQLEAAQHDYDSLQDPAFTEDTAAVRAALASAEVRAPFAGTITNLDLKTGELVAAGTPVVTLADFSRWVVKTTDLTEIDVVNIKQGQPVTITLDAIPGVTLNGHVLAIAQNFAEKQGDIVYEVTILLTDKNPAMRWGMTAEVKFQK